jgi:HEAT repeat protein
LAILNTKPKSGIIHFFEYFWGLISEGKGQWKWLFGGKPYDDDIKPFKIQAIVLLESLKDKRAIEPLHRILTEDDRCLKTYALFSLPVLKDRGCIPYLIEHIEDPTFPIEGHQVFESRSNAIRELAALGGEEAVDGLIYLLENEHKAVVVYVIEELTKSKSRKVGPALIKLTYHSDIDIRFFSINAISKIRYEGALERLSELRESPERKIRLAAKYTYEYIKKGCEEKAGSKN